uniref:CD72 molecule n=1 Tax=Prolemur simus TaxID=1328070 RepID=A0A8C8YSB9_PROSS
QEDEEPQSDGEHEASPLSWGDRLRSLGHKRADEDGELTYENVQVTPAPGGPSSLVSSGPDAGLESLGPCVCEGPCRAPCWHYLLLCLLLTCLLLGVAATCLGVRYLQASQQLQQMNRVLEATNSSLRQQLRLKITQLGQREEDLQGSRRELAQSQEALQAEQRVHQDAEEQLRACQSDREKTNKSLQGEKERRSTLEQQLSSIRDTLKPLLPCQSQDTCCPVGWIQYSKSCFYFSPTWRNWQLSKKHCESLSSKLATFSETHQNSVSVFPSSFDSEDSYWIGFYKDWHWTDRWTDASEFQCARVQRSWSWNKNIGKVQEETCSTPLPCICEMAAFRFPDGHH